VNSSDTLVEVRLLGLDLEDHRRSSQHHDELFREFAIIASSEADDAATPVRLMSLIDELTSQYAGLTQNANEELQAAVERGDAHIDLVFHLPAAVSAAVERFHELLDEADEYCRSGDLLTLAPPPDAVAFRRWYLDEFVRQIAGEAPRPWPEVREAGG
jgi:hypothetical protein